MKKAMMVVAVIVGLIAGAYTLVIVASETGEVVVLTIPDDVDVRSVRLWVVDREGVQYLRAGDEGSGWYQQLQAATTVTVERNGVEKEYVPLPSPAVQAEIASAMLNKYGWRDRYIAWMVGGRDASIPIALQPAG